MKFNTFDKHDHKEKNNKVSFLLQVQKREHDRKTIGREQVKGGDDVIKIHESGDLRLNAYAQAQNTEINQYLQCGFLISRFDRSLVSVARNTENFVIIFAHRCGTFIDSLFNESVKVSE